jgi:putative cardiolipin synthase
MMRFLKTLAVIGLTLAAFVMLARLLFPLPDISNREISSALPASDQTSIGATVADLSAAHVGQSGIIPLRSGTDALASRVELIRRAEASIDAQYYIWHDDTSGVLLLEELRNAALRGVRVRLLLDDNGVPGLDATMATLNAQPNFEIRLFNPSTIRRPKLLGYSFDFFRMNRRMHNKSLIVDGAVAIIGGRNIGDEYFDVQRDAFYIDMDALAAGKVVPETATVFDDYWNSPSVFALESIVSSDGNLVTFDQRVSEVMATPEAQRLMGDLQSSADKFARGEMPMEWTNVRVVADDPVKGQGSATSDQLMISRLGEILGQVETRLDLVSAYFVPGQRGTEYLTDLAAAGVDVRVLTNAMNTTDVLMVHSGYTRYRRALLEADVSLYELKLRAQMSADANRQLKPFGLSGASLHAKTFAVDGDRVFIGSFNFDPRSATLNCEMGFLIESPTLAGQVSAGFDGPLLTVSYQPALTPKGKMIWREPIEDGETLIYQEEPGATWFQQIAIAVIGVLPVEWLL